MTVEQNFTNNLEKDSSHPPSSGSLPLIELIKLVDELSEIVARLLNCAHQRHQGHVIALRVELGKEELRFKN